MTFYGTGLFNLKAKMPSKVLVEPRYGLQIYSIEEAIGGGRGIGTYPNIENQLVAYKIILSMLHEGSVRVR